MTLHFQPHANLVDARQRLQNCTLLANNIHGGGHHDVVTGYADWVNNTRAALRSIFSDLDTHNHLRSVAYWTITTPSFQDHRVRQVIVNEVDDQVRWLEGLIAGIGRLEQRVAAAPGVPTVLDTHVLLHYQRPDQIKWTDLLHEGEIRLVLPLRVIEEIDEKKYTAARDKLRNRARDVLSHLWGLLGDTAGAPVRLVDNVTIEVPVDDGPRSRPLDADQEILDLCLQYQSIGHDIVLVTGDTGLSFRAGHDKLRVVRMPDLYLRERPQNDPGNMMHP